MQVITDSGLTGVTNARPFMNRHSVSLLQTHLQPLIGRDIFEFHTSSGARATGVSSRWENYLLEHGFVSYALFDLMGQALGIPAYKLLGDKIRDSVEPYDSSLYFQDLIHPEEGVGAVAREAKEAVGKG
jgi:galactonate dehydratase